jgi:hypothetical protein
MNELGPEARSLLEAARDAESPTRDERARIKRGVLVQVAVLGAATTTTGGAVAMSVATKITLVGLSIAMLGGGAFSLWVWKGRPATPVAVSHQIAASPTPAVADPVTAEATTADLAPIPTIPTPTDQSLRDIPKHTLRKNNHATSPTLAASPSTSTDSLDPELTVLRQAQQDLRLGQPDQALRRLEDFDRRFGKGMLGQERQAIAAIALCQARPGPAAQTRAEQFLRTAPESPLAARVRTACKESTRGEK